MDRSTRPFSEDLTDFGFQKISPLGKKQKVEDLFNRVSSSYDLMNDLMSAGLHRLWKDYFATCVSPSPLEKILDLAGGTGDIAFRLLEKSNKPIDLFVADLSLKMIEIGQRRCLDKGILKPILWAVSSAEELPFPDNFFDKITISFGLRNVFDRKKSLSEVYRVLKTQGTFFCLEFSHPTSECLRKLYKAYSFSILPLLGELVAQQRDAYQYLVESIACFPAQEALLKEFQDAGFSSNSYENLMGGIVALHKGSKI